MNIFGIGDEFQKIDNFTASSQSPDITNIDGLIKVPEVATDRIYDSTQETYIDLDGVDVGISATDLKLNGSSVISEVGNKNLVNTLTTTQTTFTLDQELITKKYLIDSLEDLNTKTQNISLTSTDATKTTITQDLNIATVGDGTDITAFDGQGADLAIDGTTAGQLYVKTGFEFTALSNLKNIRFKIKSSQRSTSDETNRFMVVYQYNYDTNSYNFVVSLSIGKYNDPSFPPTVEGDYNLSFAYPQLNYVAGRKYAVLIDAKAGDFFSVPGTSPITVDSNISVIGSIRTDALGNFPASTNDGYSPIITLQYQVVETFDKKLSCGLIDNKNGTIINASDPVNPQDVATKNYVDLGVLPSMRMVGYSSSGVKKYVTNISAPNANSETTVNVYEPPAGITFVNNAYNGSVYSPTQNRIYFVPRNQAPQPVWHYIDCDTGAVVEYTHGASAVNGAYFGGVYSPSKNRIYFVPSGQANQTYWHYINCDTDAVVPYANNSTAVANAYNGGVYSPIQNRIYFAPRSQAPQPDWHYINCDTDAIVAYTHNTTAVLYAYASGSYSPSENRIYFSPLSQSSETYWHYINCDTEAVVPYTHPPAGGSAYNDSSYSPSENRIYFVPYGQSNEIEWHYINCDTGAVVPYEHGAAAVGGAYWGAVFSPMQNRIYFVPFDQTLQPYWHYIDCNTGYVVAYAHGSNAGNLAYLGNGTYSPTQNRLYFPPSRQLPSNGWHYLKPLTSATASISFASSVLMDN